MNYWINVEKIVTKSWRCWDLNVTARNSFEFLRLMFITVFWIWSLTIILNEQLKIKFKTIWVDIYTNFWNLSNGLRIYVCHSEIVSTPESLNPHSLHKALLNQLNVMQFYSPFIRTVEQQPVSPTFLIRICSFCSTYQL